MAAAASRRSAAETRGQLLPPAGKPATSTAGKPPTTVAEGEGRLFETSWERKLKVSSGKVGIAAELESVEKTAAKPQS